VKRSATVRWFGVFIWVVEAIGLLNSISVRSSSLCVSRCELADVNYILGVPSAHCFVTLSDSVLSGAKSGWGEMVFMLSLLPFC